MSQNYSNIVAASEDTCYKKLYEDYRDLYREAAKNVPDPDTIPPLSKMENWDWVTQAVTISNIFEDFMEWGRTVKRIDLTQENVMTVLDQLMTEMTQYGIPTDNRILYVSSTTRYLIMKAKQYDGCDKLDNIIDRSALRLVEIPDQYFQTSWYDYRDREDLYNPEDPYGPAEDAEQIQMMLIHPDHLRAVSHYDFYYQNGQSEADKKYLFYEINNIKFGRRGEKIADFHWLQNNGDQFACQFVLPSA